MGGRMPRIDAGTAIAFDDGDVAASSFEQIRRREAHDTAADNHDIDLEISIK
jgi:hypothetical protein